MSKKKPANMGPADVLTAVEVARWLRIPRSTLYRLCQEGKIPVVKIGRHWRFDRLTIENWFKRRMSSNEDER